MSGVVRGYQRVKRVYRGYRGFSGVIRRYQGYQGFSGDIGVVKGCRGFPGVIGGCQGMTTFDILGGNPSSQELDSSARLNGSFFVKRLQIGLTGVLRS